MQESFNIKNTISGLTVENVTEYMNGLGSILLLTIDEEKELVAVIRNGGKAAEEARESLYVANLRFVVPIAKKYMRSEQELPSLIEQGNLGLLKAIDHYDGDKGYKFLSYAVWWIKESVLKALNKNTDN